MEPGRQTAHALLSLAGASPGCSRFSTNEECDGLKEAAKEAGGFREVWRPQGRRLVAVGLALAIAQQFIGVNTVIYYAPTILKFTGLLALVCLIAYVASFAVGLGPVFWLMISEIFPLKVRSPAMSLSAVGNWTSNFLVSSFFLTLVGAISREGTFWLYAGLGVLALICFLARVPETKGRSIEEIASDLGANQQRHGNETVPAH